MPKIAPPIGATVEDTVNTIDELLKSTKRLIDVTAATKPLESLGITSGSSSEMRQMTEALSGLATGLKSIGETTTTLFNQLAQMYQNSNGKMQITDLIGLLLVSKMLEPKKEEKPPEIPPLLKEYLSHLEEEIRELKDSRSPSPVDQRMHELTLHLLSQHMTTLTDPFSGLRKLGEVKDILRDLVGERSLPPEYTENGLRMKALEKEEKALELEERKFLAELNHKERLWSQQVPAVIAQAGTVLANVLGSYGLAPVRTLDFDTEARSVADSIARGGASSESPCPSCGGSM